MHQQYIRAADAFILVYSSTSRSSFSNVRKHYERTLEPKSSLWRTSSTQTSGTRSARPTILVCTKKDMQNMSSEPEVTSRDGRRLASDLGCEYVEVSAKQGTMTDQPFRDLVRRSRQNRIPTARNHGWQHSTSSGTKAFIAKLINKVRKNV